ncbi:dynein axonemal assembly factor 4 [Diabrotica undecimpunctata]|uniref:dynein axonemal assembly factor 4 n=1 Tax=Diabrotica undecimpunctata TaxID=50387 RepID=UPI003B63A79C
MPIVIKDYIWKQTKSDIIVQVPMKGVHQSKLDVFISSRFVKATYERNYFELILFSKIIASDSKCILTPTEVVFELKKAEDIDWDYLEPNVSKTEKLELKKLFLEESFKEIQAADEKKCERKHELKRLAVKKQIEIDSENRDTIDNIRREEEKRALGDLEEFKKKVSQKLKSSNNQNLKPKKILPTNFNKVNEEIPKTRSSQTLTIDFTSREFPTPCRESKLEEEHEYLTKQAEARRSVGFVSEDIRPEERNPHFIKAKGDKFLKNKNYLGAISAYSYGIKLSKNFVDFYICRSEAHMGLGNLWRAIEDCSTALDLLQPICEANLYERAVCSGRRGEALCKYGKRRQGIGELKHSLKLIDLEYYRDVLGVEEKLYEQELEISKQDQTDKQGTEKKEGNKES